MPENPGPRNIYPKILLITLLSLSSSILFGMNHDCLILTNETDVSVRRQILVTRTVLLIQINSREGEKAAEFQLYYSPGFKLNKLTAWIQDTTGHVIRKLEKSQIKDRSAFTYGTFYSDYMIRSFELKHNHFPYQIHVEYCHETDHFLQIANWSPVYEPDAPTIHATLTIEIPVNYPVRILRQKIGLPVIDTVDKTIRYRWTCQYLQLIKQETWQPPYNDLHPFVLIVPGEFEYGIRGSFASWESFGDYIDNLMEGLDILPASEISRVKSIASGITDTMELIRKVYHYLQDNTRYLSVSIDIGGIRPYPASFVAQNKYGDCKALALYMQSLLKVSGIHSCFTLVSSTYLPDKIDPGFPAQQFNHAILCVPYRSDTIWLDCTNKIFPAGYTSGSIQGRPALVVSRGKSKLVNIPPLNFKDVEVTHTYLCKVIDSVTTEITVHSKYRGPWFEKVLHYTENEDLNSRKKYARELIPYDNFELMNYSFFRSSKEDQSINFYAQVKVKDDIKTSDDRVVFAPPAVDLPVFEKISAREYPVVLPYPLWYHDTLIVMVPDGMTVKSTPSVELTCETGSYTVSTSLDHNNLVYVRDIRLRRGMYASEQYPALYNWTGAIRAFERQNKIIFTPAHE
jgi:hypothetical protein